MGRRTNRGSAPGFSIVELTVVLGIVLVLSAIAVPTVSNVLTSAQLRGGMGDLSGLFQNARNIAVRQNRISKVHFQVSNGRQLAYVDWINCDPVNGWCGQPTKSTPQVYLPESFTEVSAPSGGSGAPSAVTAATCGSATALDSTKTDDTYFNQMGIPCQYDSTTNPSCSGSQAFAYYFNYVESSHTNWTALCVSPAGRIKAWYWTGSAWTN
jgi:Tfp pilus assembly protein FimT